MPYKRKFVSKKKRAVSRRKSVSSSMNRRRLTTMIKRAVLKKAEPKCKRFAFEKTEIYHNSFYSPGGAPPSGYICAINNYGLMPAQGTGDNQRVGDQINVSGFKLKLLIGQKADRPNVSFRWFVLRVPKGSAISYTTWFVGTTGNVLLDDPNTDFVKVLRSGLWRPNEAGLANTGGDEYTFAKRLWIPYKKLIKFGPADAATTHNDDDLYFTMVGYDAYGTLQTDNIAYAQMGLELHYRDP